MTQAEDRRSSTEGRGVLRALGVAALLLGDSRDQLRRELVAAFPGATVVEDQASREATLAKISLHLDDPGTDPSLRLDLRDNGLITLGSAERQHPNDVVAVLDRPYDRFANVVQERHSSIRPSA